MEEETTMKKLVTLLLAAMMMLTAMTAFAEEKTVMNWAYGAMPLNNGNVGTDLLHRCLL